MIEYDFEAYQDLARASNAVVRERDALRAELAAVKAENERLRDRLAEAETKYLYRPEKVQLLIGDHARTLLALRERAKKAERERDEARAKFMSERRFAISAALGEEESNERRRRLIDRLDRILAEARCWKARYLAERGEAHRAMQAARQAYGAAEEWWALWDRAAGRLNAAEARERVLATALRALVDHVRESAPLTWAATMDQAGAHDWERRVETVLRAADAALAATEEGR